MNLQDRRTKAAGSNEPSKKEINNLQSVEQVRAGNIVAFAASRYYDGCVWMP
jgi:hypothetical protein